MQARRFALAAMAGACLCVIAAAMPQVAQAQTYPTRAISLLVGFPAGGGFDTVMRALAEEMSKNLGHPVTVENRPGASGAIATQALVAAAADGYTLLAAGLQLATGPHLNKVSYNPQTDLVMVRQVSSVPVLLLTHAASPIRTGADIVALARKNGNGVTIGTGGPGTTGHFGTFVVGTGLNVQTVHVPFRGGAPALTALAGGEVDLLFDQPSGAMQGMLDSKRVRVVALMQENPSSGLPGVKTAKEIGLPLELELRGWQGIGVRGGTAAAIVKRLDAAVAAAAASPVFKARLAGLGIDATGNVGPAEFQKHYLDELNRWGAFIKKYDIKAN